MKRLKSILKYLLYFFGILILVVAILATYLFIQINRSDGQIKTTEGARKYLLHVPGSYDAGNPTPLVISIHGYAEWPAHQMQISHWNELAGEENFIVVYPRGTDFPLRWRTNGLGDSLLDVEFIDDMITDFISSTVADIPGQVVIPYPDGLLWKPRITSTPPA